VACLASSVGRGEWPTSRARTENAAGRRVLHRIADEIYKNLPQVSRIGSDARKCHSDGDRQIQTAFVDERLELTRHIEHERTEHDGLRMNLQSTGGNLRDVQHLVDEVAQVGR
jgi:hypothetical protein